MTKGISNFEIERVFKEINNDDLNKNFIGVFPSDKFNKFIMFKRMMLGKNALVEYFEYFTQKVNYFFYSVGIDGLKHFIVQDDTKTVGKVLKGIELANRTDDKITLIKLKFSMNRYYNVTANEIDKLSEIAQDFFHLIYCFEKNEKITNFVNAWMLEDPLQKKTQ